MIYLNETLLIELPYNCLEFKYYSKKESLHHILAVANEDEEISAELVFKYDII
jgi:hypothetical protein